MSIRMTDDHDLKQLCGSPHYVAPELIRRAYRFKVDMWALGVVVFLMIYGKYPFDGRDQNSIVRAILNSHPDYNQKNPDARLSSYEAMQHPWILKYAHESHRHMEDDFECSEFRLPKAPSDPGTPRMESS